MSRGPTARRRTAPLSTARLSTARLLTAPLPTAPLAAATLIVGYAAVVASGSRTVGGFVLALGAVLCIRIWTVRHGARTAAKLAGVGFAAFVLSHVLGLVVGAWPAVLIVAGLGAVAVWSLADSRVRPALAFRPPAR